MRRQTRYAVWSLATRKVVGALRTYCGWSGFPVMQEDEKGELQCIGVLRTQRELSLKNRKQLQCADEFQLSSNYITVE